jgi:hypothetical protein
MAAIAKLKQRVAELEAENADLRQRLADVSRETERDVSRETAPAKKAAAPARKR